MTVETMKAAICALIVLSQAEARVRALHRPIPSRAWRDRLICAHSDSPYPCRTIRELDGVRS